MVNFFVHSPTPWDLAPSQRAWSYHIRSKHKPLNLSYCLIHRSPCQTSLNVWRGSAEKWRWMNRREAETGRGTFLAAGEAYEAIFWPTSGSRSPGFERESFWELLVQGGGEEKCFCPRKPRDNSECTRWRAFGEHFWAPQWQLMFTLFSLLASYWLWPQR